MWQGHVKGMTSPIIAAAGERYSMVSAEGLRVCESLVHIMRPDLSKPMPPSHKVRQLSRARDALSWLSRHQGFTLTGGPRKEVLPLAGQQSSGLPCCFVLGGDHECSAYFVHAQASASEVLKAVRVRLTAQDLDQEVKECAVSCAAALVAQLGDALQADYTSLMQARPCCTPSLWPGWQPDALPRLLHS